MQSAAVRTVRPSREMTFDFEGMFKVRVFRKKLSTFDLIVSSDTFPSYYNSPECNLHKNCVLVSKSQA